MTPVKLVEVVRGDMVESSHYGHVVIADNQGNIQKYWGDPYKLIYPRSACKILQALPLIETGAADYFDLNLQQLALACSSHNGEQKHLVAANRWFKKLKLKKFQLLCGAHDPYDDGESQRLSKEGMVPSPMHNNCSGKHLGFLTLAKFFDKNEAQDIDYTCKDHLVQKLVKQTFEEMTGAKSRWVAVDGCSAPNFSCSLIDLAISMARLSQPTSLPLKRKFAVELLKTAIIQNPYMIAGTDRLCSKIIERSEGRLIVKVGAEGVYTASLIEEGLGLAIKISDGAKRAAECVLTTILYRYGFLKNKGKKPEIFLRPPIFNWNNKLTGFIQASETLWQDGERILGR